MNRWLQIVAGLGLLLVSLAGLSHGIQGARAQKLYFDAKYGWATNNVAAVFELLDRAQDLYPWNYNACILAGETAWHSASLLKGHERDDRLALAARWCDEGLRLNAYPSQLRHLRTMLVAENDLPRAVAIWREHVDWDYWVPYNHAVLVELLARSGDLEEAIAEMEWVKGSSNEEWARARIRDAWARERQLSRGRPKRSLPGEDRPAR